MKIKLAQNTKMYGLEDLELTSNCLIDAIFCCLACNFHIPLEEFETQQSSVILDLCLSKTRAGKSHDYRNLVVVEKLQFQNVFCPD